MFELTMVCRKEIVEKGILVVEKTLEKQFSSWFKKHVSIQSKVCFHAIFNCILVQSIFSPLDVGYLIVQIAKLRFMKGEEVPDGLYALSCEPDLRVRIFSGCLIDGIRFHTTDRDKSRRMQNSGVMVESTHDGDPIDFYGSLKEIIELQYNSDLQWFSSDVIGLILMPKVLE